MMIATVTLFEVDYKNKTQQELLQLAPDMKKYLDNSIDEEDIEIKVVLSSENNMHSEILEFESFEDSEYGNDYNEFDKDENPEEWEERNEEIKSYEEDYERLCENLKERLLPAIQRFRDLS